jgi:arsenate reductase-like glutaredoxin family protein
MIDMRNLPPEIADLDKLIQSLEHQLNELRQQREFKIALLRQLQDTGFKPAVEARSIEQKPDVIS